MTPSSMVWTVDTLLACICPLQLGVHVTLTTRRARKLLPSCSAHRQPPPASWSASRSARPAPYLTPAAVHAARSLSRT